MKKSFRAVEHFKKKCFWKDCMNRLQQNTIITAVCITFRRDSLYNPYFYSFCFYLTWKGVKILSKDPLFCCCTIVVFDPAVVSYYICTWTGRWKRRATFCLPSHGVYPYLSWTHARALRANLCVVWPWSQISREMYTNSYTSSLVCSACVLHAAGIFQQRRFRKCRKARHKWSFLWEQTRIGSTVKVHYSSELFTFYFILKCLEKKLKITPCEHEHVSKFRKPKCLAAVTNARKSWRVWIHNDFEMSDSHAAWHDNYSAVQNVSFFSTQQHVNMSVLNENEHWMYYSWKPICIFFSFSASAHSSGGIGGGCHSSFYRGQQRYSSKIFATNPLLAASFLSGLNMRTSCYCTALEI